MDRTLAAVCDHLLWGAADLHEAIAAFAARTGIRAAPGGRHPDLGTHNAIATLGPKRFLEIIAPDPTLRPGALAGRLASMKTPALIMWAARTSSAAATAARSDRVGGILGGLSASASCREGRPGCRGSPSRSSG